MLEATNSWSVNIDNGFLNGVVFIDLKKAFGTSDHEIILRKLSYFGADQETAKFFQSYLSNRTQRCNLSTASTVSCGVPQGSILGPLLFLMCINDLPNCLGVAAPRMFADDTSITLSAKTVADLKLAVTSELNNLTCWLRANKLSLNVAKTELMIIGSRPRLIAQCGEINISIDDRTIKRVDHSKSLGLTIDAQLSWSKHVDEISKKVSSALGALKRVRPFIPTDVAVQIYNALRWLKTVYSTKILMGFYSHSLSLAAAIMVSKNCPAIGEHVVVKTVSSSFQDVAFDGSLLPLFIS